MGQGRSHCEDREVRLIGEPAAGVLNALAAVNRAAGGKPGGKEEVLFVLRSLGIRCRGHRMVAAFLKKHFTSYLGGYDGYYD